MVDAIRSRFKIVVISLLVGIVLAGCSSVPNPKDIATDLLKDNPPTLQGAIIAGSQLNQRSDGVSTSVVVQLMELKEITEFQQQDFFAVVRSAQEVLGNNLLDVKEFVVLPDKITLLEPRELAEGTTHLGVVVDFRDWSNATWRQVVPLRQDKTTRLKITIDGNSVTAATESRKWWRKTKSAYESQIK